MLKTTTGVLIFSCGLIHAVQNCAKYHIQPATLEFDVPQIDTKSEVALIFNNLHGKLNAHRTVNPKTGIPCYEWECQSQERHGEQCQWCLPGVFVGGFSKCGTTALCDKLGMHPSIRNYRRKEVNLFSKVGTTYKLSEFEERVNETHDRMFFDNRLQKMIPFRDIRNLTENRMGELWMDCTAGAFRDFNAAAHLLKYSPRTKVLMMVRDPWQNMGSRIGQQIRHGRAPKRKMTQLMRQFKSLQYTPQERFTRKNIATIARSTDYAYAEKLLYWRAAFPSNMSLLVIDQFDLQHKPIDTMRKIETFLGIDHFSYPEEILYSVSRNAYLLPSVTFGHKKSNKGGTQSEEGEEEREQDGNSNTSSGGIDIHKPYSFRDMPLLFKLSKSVIEPSLCLFEQVFGWRIRIITEETDV